MMLLFCFVLFIVSVRTKVKKYEEKTQKQTLLFFPLLHLFLQSSFFFVHCFSALTINFLLHISALEF